MKNKRQSLQKAATDRPSLLLNYLLISLLLTPWICASQISGTVIDVQTEKPITFVNVWVKNSLKGATTNEKGVFHIKNGVVGDTLLISNLGYEEKQLVAKTNNPIKLIPKEIALDEVIVIPLKEEKISELKSYKNKGKIKDFYFNGHYSLARYFPYNEQFNDHPFIKSVSLITLSALKNDVSFRVQLIRANKQGRPTKIPLSEYYLVTAGKGKNEVKINLLEEKLLFPENGFFVVVDRLNLEENKFSNKLAKNILQPAIGIEPEDSETVTWMSFGGLWIHPNDLQNFAGTNKNIAVNIELTD